MRFLFGPSSSGCAEGPPWTNRLPVIFQRGAGERERGGERKREQPYTAVPPTSAPQRLGSCGIGVCVPATVTKIHARCERRVQGPELKVRLLFKKKKKREDEEGCCRSRMFSDAHSPCMHRGCHVASSSLSFFFVALKRCESTIGNRAVRALPQPGHQAIGDRFPSRAVSGAPSCVNLTGRWWWWW